MPYIVLVDDNFHYQDLEERWRLGEFEHAVHALAACRHLVDSYLKRAVEGGTPLDGLLESYKMFGDDPFLQCVDVPRVTFSAWDYAHDRALMLRALGVAGAAEAVRLWA